eukprot:Seg1335.9 transcript_id=Seg1335.9/GoldUCD/mRNA.D3Y31 product="hypothetical protein" protein_id=Seg1335.9/GoldUCD/D3Y31
MLIVQFGDMFACWCWWLIITISCNYLYCKDIFVSPNGHDFPGCGELQNPCETIIHAAEEEALTNDVIRIDGKARTVNISRPIRATSTNFSAITITSYDGIATVQTLNLQGNQLITFSCKKDRPFKDSSNYSVTIQDLNFHNVHLLTMSKSWFDVASLQFYIHRCGLKFDESPASSGSSRILVRSKISTFLLEMKNCSVNGSTSAGLFEISVSSRVTSEVTIRIESSKIHNTRFAIKARHNRAQLRKNCYVDFIIKDSDFTSSPKSKHDFPIFKVMGITVSSEVRLMVTVNMTNCQFRNRVLASIKKYAAILVVDGFVDVVISKCFFHRNTGRRGGAVAIGTKKKRKIEDSTFEENRASTLSICGGDDLSGNGGAVLINQGKHKLSKTVFQNVTFRNNRASCFGDSVYAVKCQHIFLQSTTFYRSSDGAYHGISKGTMWYSQSVKISTSDVKVILAGTATRSSTIFFASARKHPHSHKIDKFQCPLSSNIRLNSTQRSGFHTLIVDCIVCPLTKYTIDHSYAKVKRFHGTPPEIHHAECQECPFGAHCKHSVVPKRNFWGQIVNRKVQMISCPPGYCCQKKNKCKRLNSCNGKRTGTLCGRCLSGYFLSFFANRCVKMNDCNIGQFWGLLAVAAIVFGILFVYLQQIFGLIVRLFNAKETINLIKKDIPNRSKMLNREYKQADKMHKGILVQRNEALHCEESRLESRHFKEKHICNIQETESRVEEDGVKTFNEWEVEDLHTEASRIDSRQFQEESHTCIQEGAGETEAGVNEKLTKAKASLVSDEEDTNSTSGGLIKILFFYYQMNDLLLLYRSDIQHIATDMLKKTLRSFFNLEPSALSATGLGCPVKSLSAVQKSLIKSFFPLMMLVALTLMHVLVSVIAKISSKTSISRFIHTFKTSLQVAALQIILLGYSTLTSHILALLTCVPLADDKQVLFIDGNISCYQQWQYVLLAVVNIWSIPLVYAFFAASKSLRDNSLSVRGFYAALIFPLPFALYSLFRSKYLKKIADDSEKLYEPEDEITYHKINDGESLTRNLLSQQSFKDEQLRRKINNVLGGSFRHIGKTSQRLPWEPMLILQRLLLLMLHAFLINPMTRSLSLLFAIFLITNLNIIIKPFHNTFLNILNCLCLSFLFVSAVLSSFYAYIYVGGTALTGPFLAILSTLDVIELAMQLSFPCIALLITGLAIIARLTHMLCVIIKRATKLCTKQEKTQTD